MLSAKILDVFWLMGESNNEMTDECKSCLILAIYPKPINFMIPDGQGLYTFPGNQIGTVFYFFFQLLRARHNEKEMKVKPITSFKLLTIFIHKK